MKQQISKQQWEDLNEEEQRFLKQFKKDFSEDNLFTIGELIEILQDTYDNNINIGIEIDKTDGYLIWLSTGNYGDSKWLMSQEKELIDSLWEAVLESEFPRMSELDE